MSGHSLQKNIPMHIIKCALDTNTKYRYNTVPVLGCFRVAYQFCEYFSCRETVASAKLLFLYSISCQRGQSSLDHLLKCFSPDSGAIKLGGRALQVLQAFLVFSEINVRSILKTFGQHPIQTHSRKSLVSVYTACHFTFIRQFLNFDNLMVVISACNQLPYWLNIA